MNGKILNSELVNRKNDPETKVCLHFEYDLSIDNGDNTFMVLTFRFNRTGDKTWMVELVIGYQVYKVEFDVPKNNMDLTMVAAFGLRHIQYQIEQEVQSKSIIDFSIGDTIKDM